MSNRATIFVLDGTRSYVILIKRIKDGRTYHVLPGGRVEAGETALSAAIRELREELELVMTEADVFHVLEEADNTTFFIKTADAVGDLTIHGEEKARSSLDNRYDPQWVKWKDLEHLNFFPHVDFDFISQICK